MRLKLRVNPTVITSTSHRLARVPAHSVCVMAIPVLAWYSAWATDAPSLVSLSIAMLLLRSTWYMWCFSVWGNIPIH